MTVPCAGIVVLGFDNSGMWFSSKQVRFRARLEEAGADRTRVVQRAAAAQRQAPQPTPFGQN